MSNTLKVLVSGIFLCSACAALAGDIHEVVVLDPMGDTPGCVAAVKHYNEVAREAVPENHPTVRLVEGTIAGNQSGLLWLVVEYDDLADLARVQAQMEDNEAVTAVEAEFAKVCKAVSTSVGTQLYYHEGT